MSMNTSDWYVTFDRRGVQVHEGGGRIVSYVDCLCESVQSAVLNGDTLTVRTDKSDIVYKRAGYGFSVYRRNVR